MILLENSNENDDLFKCEDEEKVQFNRRIKAHQIPRMSNFAPNYLDYLQEMQMKESHEKVSHKLLKTIQTTNTKNHNHLNLSLDSNIVKYPIINSRINRSQKEQYQTIQPYSCRTSLDQRLPSRRNSRIRKNLQEINSISQRTRRPECSSVTLSPQNKYPQIVRQTTALQENNEINNQSKVIENLFIPIPITIDDIKTNFAIKDDKEQNQNSKFKSINLDDLVFEKINFEIESSRTKRILSVSSSQQSTFSLVDQNECLAITENENENQSKLTIENKENFEHLVKCNQKKTYNITTPYNQILNNGGDCNRQCRKKSPQIESKNFENMQVISDNGKMLLDLRNELSLMEELFQQKTNLQNFESICEQTQQLQKEISDLKFEMKRTKSAINKTIDFEGYYGKIFASINTVSSQLMREQEKNIELKQKVQIQNRELLEIQYRMDGVSHHHLRQFNQFSFYTLKNGAKDPDKELSKIIKQIQYLDLQEKLEQSFKQLYTLSHRNHSRMQLMFNDNQKANEQIRILNQQITSMELQIQKCKIKFGILSGNSSHYTEEIVEVDQSYNKDIYNEKLIQPQFDSSQCYSNDFESYNSFASSFSHLHQFDVMFQT